MITCYVKTYSSHPYSGKFLNYFRGLFSAFLYFFLYNFELFFQLFNLRNISNIFKFCPEFCFFMSYNKSKAGVPWLIQFLKKSAFFSVTRYIILHNMIKHICRKTSSLFLYCLLTKGIKYTFETLFIKYYLAKILESKWFW